MRKAAKRIALVLCSTAIALVAAESALRALGYGAAYYYPQFLFTADPDLGYRLTPGFSGRQVLGEFDVHLAVTRSGLRAPQPTAPPGATCTILGLGDSFTFGHGVEANETYLSLLAQRLVSDGRRVQVINAGVPGYGTRQQAAFLSRQGGRFQPDVVLLGLLPFNDPHDNLAPDPLVRDGFLVGRTVDSAGDVSLMYAFKSLLRRRSALYGTVANGVKGIAPLRSRLARFGLAEEGFAVEVQSYLTSPPASAEAAWAATVPLLQRLREQSASLGARLIILLVPSRAQVDRERWNRLSAQHGLQEHQVDPQLPIRTVTRHLDALGIAYLDLQATLQRRIESGETLYFDVDGHWNTAGHRAAADALRMYLAEQSWMPLCH